MGRRRPAQGRARAKAPTLQLRSRRPGHSGLWAEGVLAALEARLLPEMTRDADKVIVPVLPSDIDIHACSRCVQNLLLIAKVHRNDHRLGIIANRVRLNTAIYHSLSRFLRTLGIPIVATLRDSQNYVRAAELGLGLEEMKPYQVADDLAAWQPLLDWLDVPSTRSSEPEGLVKSVRLA